MASEKEVLHFRCFFDLYTPRPHIIIKVNERLQEKAKKEDVRLLSASALSALLSFARCAQKQYSFTAARLSFHCGSFQSDPYFHAHLCVDTEEYLAAYRLINLSEQATRRHVTRQWKRGKETPSSSDYAKCVRTYADHQAVKAQGYWLQDAKHVETVIAEGKFQDLTLFTSSSSSTQWQLC